MRFGVLALVGVLAACEMTAPLPTGVSGADVALFRSAMEDTGCTVNTPETAAPVEDATGFDEYKLRAIADYLVETGEMEALDPYGFRLTSGSCADA